ncbi:MAG: hypothetical protein JXR67_01045 [Bacteroidales bacterium]|nr:hypothetical protein [Bacteroidales bacterium]
MNRFLVITLLLPLLCCFSCKKTEFAPVGPTDVRIKNISGIELTNVVVRIKEEEISFGTIGVSGISEYHLFEMAFPKAYISAKANNEILNTGPVDFTYMNYFGQNRITYDVTVENSLIVIKNVTLDSPL